MVKATTHVPLPETGEGKRGEDGYFGYLLRQAANGYRYRVEQVLSDLQLTQPQFAVMTMLRVYPGHSGADLARLALLTPQTMSVIVGNLLKIGFVDRRAHEIHGRIQHLQLTELGQEVLQAAKRRVYALEDEMLNDLPKDGKAIIKAWLIAVASKGGEIQR